MKLKFIYILIVCLSLLCLTSQPYWMEEKYKGFNRTQYRITQIDEQVIKLEHKTYNTARYLNIEDQHVSIDALRKDMQVFDLINTDTNLYNHKYQLKKGF